MADKSSLGVSLTLRATSVVLLLIALGYLIYCSKKFGQDMGSVFGMVSVVLIFHLGMLTRICRLISSGAGASGPFRPELAWTCCGDTVATVLAIFGGILVIVYWARPPECGSGDCEAFRSDPSEQYRAMAAYLLFGVSGVTFLSAVDDLGRCCSRRAR